MAAAALFAAAPAWVWLVAPQLTKIPADFNYENDVISLDNLYDEGKRRFAGEKRSDTRFHYAVAARDPTLNPADSR